MRVVEVKWIHHHEIHHCLSIIWTLTAQKGRSGPPLCWPTVFLQCSSNQVTMDLNNSKSPQQCRPAHCALDRELHFRTIQCSTVEGRSLVKGKCPTCIWGHFQWLAFTMDKCTYISIRWRWEKGKKHYQILNLMQQVWF